MKRKLILMFTVLIVIAIACKEKPKKNNTQLNNTNALIIGNPFDYGTDNILIFPVGSNYKAEVYNKIDNLDRLSSSDIKLSFSQNNNATLYDKTAEKEYLNTDENKFDIRNILFYNLKTGISYPLINDTLHILSFAIHKEFEKPLIFYRIVKNDNNADSIYNSLDPVMLFISDIYGKNFVQITPENEKYSDYTYYKQTNTILIKTIIDSDNDKSFSNIDETNFREMKIINPSFGREIFEKSLKDSLRMQMKIK